MLPIYKKTQTSEEAWGLIVKLSGMCLHYRKYSLDVQVFFVDNRKKNLTTCFKCQKMKFFLVWRYFFFKAAREVINQNEWEYRTDKKGKEIIDMILKESTG